MMLAEPGECAGKIFIIDTDDVDMMTTSQTSTSRPGRASKIGDDRNRIIRPETGTEPEFRFRLTGTGMAFKHFGSG